MIPCTDRLSSAQSEDCSPLQYSEEQTEDKERSKPLIIRSTRLLSKRNPSSSDVLLFEHLAPSKKRNENDLPNRQSFWPRGEILREWTRFLEICYLQMLVRPLVAPILLPESMIWWCIVFFSSQRDTDPCYVFLLVGRGRRARQPILFIVLSPLSRSTSFHTIKVNNHSAGVYDSICVGMDEFSPLQCSYNYIFNLIEPTAEEKIQVSRYIRNSSIRLNDNSLVDLEQPHWKG